MRVAVTGGRSYADAARVHAELSKLTITRLIHGCAAGADDLCADWADERGIARQPFIAEWVKYGKSAGPIRNSMMIHVGKPELLIAFPGGKGTADMVRQARAANIPVIEVDEEINKK